MRNRSNGNGRFILAVIVAIISIISFLSSREFNPITGEDQFVGLTKNQEIALGLNSVPTVYAEHGPLYNDPEVQAYVDEIGFKLVSNSIAAQTDWAWEFYVLDNPELVNAFALPGGQIFITTALLSEIETEAQLAAVLSHEIVHVLARHGAQHMAQSQLSQGLLEAVAIASSPDSAQQAAAIAQLINMRYGREDELQSDAIGVEILVNSGYTPYAMIELMEILARSGGAGPPEFFSTHPNPENRIAELQRLIEEMFPNGVPDNLEG